MSQQNIFDVIQQVNSSIYKTRKLNDANYKLIVDSHNLFQDDLIIKTINEVLTTTDIINDIMTSLHIDNNTKQRERKDAKVSTQIKNGVVKTWVDDKKIAFYKTHARLFNVLCMININLDSLSTKFNMQVKYQIEGYDNLLFYSHDTSYNKMFILIENNVKRASMLMKNLVPGGHLILYIDAKTILDKKCFEILLGINVMFTTNEVYKPKCSNKYDYSFTIIYKGYRTIAIQDNKMHVNLIQHYINMITGIANENIRLFTSSRGHDITVGRHEELREQREKKVKDYLDEFKM
jgi:hypothetical protein